MIYLLDTNICIHFFRGKYGVSEQLEPLKADNFAISEITLAELVYGAENSNSTDRNHKLINDFLELITVVPIYDAIMIYGKEKARLKKSGQLISDFDLLIGCTAVANDLIMVTENESEFNRIKRIKIENWVNRNI